MAYSLYKTVGFGSGKAGLATVGSQLFNADGTANGARVTAGIQDLGGGAYGALATFPDAFRGRITWDTGEGTPAKASEEINPEGASEYLDVKVSSRTTLGNGANSVTLTLQDDAVPAQRVPNRRVTVKNAAETATLAVGDTDASGQIIFNLDDSTYHILVETTPAHAALPAQTLVVSGTTSATYTLTKLSPGLPASPSLCRVYGYLKKPDGSVAASIPVEFVLRGSGAFKAAGNVVVVKAVTATTDASGYFQADLTRSSALTPMMSGDSTEYHVRSLDARLSHLFTVPDQDSADISALTLTAV
ncbi:MAG: hypothetical protein HY320_01940 [Armatimonadetes bacterium]|nr:hypothetical protein [Armatimonadota bacterium]